MDAVRLRCPASASPAGNPGVGGALGGERPRCRQGGTPTGCAEPERGCGGATMGGVASTCCPSGLSWLRRDEPGGGRNQEEETALQQRRGGTGPRSVGTSGHWMQYAMHQGSGEQQEAALQQRRMREVRRGSGRRGRRRSTWQEAPSPQFTPPGGVVRGPMPSRGAKTPEPAMGKGCCCRLRDGTGAEDWGLSSRACLQAGRFPQSRRETHAGIPSQGEERAAVVRALGGGFSPAAGGRAWRLGWRRVRGRGCGCGVRGGRRGGRRVRRSRRARGGTSSRP